jgi:hypothetical protein
MHEHTFVRRKDAEREEARRLRATGLSVRRIANRLDVSLSSVSVWVRDVPVPVREEPPPPPGRVASEAETFEGERRCSRCEQTLPLSAFNRSGAGRQHWCRECFRRYFADRGRAHREHVKRNRADRQARARAHVRAFLAEHPCVDCGEGDPVVLELDHHRGEKTKAVSQLVIEAASTQRIDRELALCEVVCACCHRRRTATRAGWYRATGVPRPWWTRGQRRNAEYLLHLLRAASCVDCGEDDPVVLDFDHRGDKDDEIAKLANSCGLARLEREIAKCDVRCANCHRRKTLHAVGAWRTVA